MASLKRITITAVSLAALLPLRALATDSAGCGSSGLKSGTYTITSLGKERVYRVHVPRGFNNNQAAPLVAIFHGWGGNENEFLSNRKVRSEADKRGYILVAPRGLGSSENNYNSWSFSGSTSGIAGDNANICDTSITPDYSYTSCKDEKIAQNSCSWTHCQLVGPGDAEDLGDVEFAVDLVAEVASKLCVDTDKVFATGGSNGGMFTWELGQNPVSAPTFKAIAPVIGLPHRGYLAGPANGKLMPALLITGTRDTTVPPGDWEDPNFTTTSNGNDRFYYTGATGITRSWAEAFNCDTSSPAVPFNDGVRKTDCRTYCDAGSGWPTVLDCRARMGHTYSLSWSWKLTLNFFDAHSR
jgi:poly(3-hydroxybutyrate) depolymerase